MCRPSVAGLELCRPEGVARCAGVGPRPAVPGPCARSVLGGGRVEDVGEGVGRLQDVRGGRAQWVDGSGGGAVLVLIQAGFAQLPGIGGILTQVVAVQLGRPALIRPSRQELMKGPQCGLAAKVVEAPLATRGNRNCRVPTARAERLPSLALASGVDVHANFAHGSCAVTFASHRVTATFTKRGNRCRNEIEPEHLPRVCSL